MIKFFRKIRQKLISENRFSKYMLYAIGEIVLVVIGILIALQINNWSSNKKEIKLETKMLEEIRVALKSDLKDLDFNLTYQNDIFQSQKALLEWLKTDEPYSDSISSHFFKVIDGTSFLSNYGSYETLKGIGIQLIKNDSLRKQILNLYELKYEEYYIVSKQINDYRFNLITKENEKYFQATSPYIDMMPIDVEKLKSENGYMYHLTTMASWNKYFIQNKITSTKVALEKTIEHIEQELEK